jgi:class 3 adenylate cyclase
VIIEGDDIHGDGVNVAARLEGLGAAGRIMRTGRGLRLRRRLRPSGWETGGNV